MRHSYSSYSKIINTPAIVRLLLLISIISSILIGAVFVIFKGWKGTSTSLLIMALVSLILFYLQRRVSTQVIALLLYLQISVILTYNVSIGHGIYDEAMLVFPLLIVFSGLIFGKSSAALVTGISLTQIILVYILAEAGHVHPFDGALEMSLIDAITTCVLMLATGFLIWVVVDIIEKSADRINQSELDIENAYDQTLIAWAKSLELRQREDPGHSARVSSLVALFAEDIELSPRMVKAAWRGALMHDIGKVGVPEKILLKNESLNPEEEEICKTHPWLGKILFDDVDYLNDALEIVIHHHERYDGKGYPGHLKGDEIPYLAQLFSIVDCWDVLRNGRPCRSAWSDDETLAFLKEQSGRKFHPELIEHFLEMVQKFGLKEN